jgi:hypothetical protein
MESIKRREIVRKKIKDILGDPLVKILLNNSYLTKIQLETLLIDVFTEEVAGIKLGYGEKTNMRISKQTISRGAFNRTLSQGKRNVNNAINTVILLGYLKILETPKMSPFIEIANRLNEYMKAYNLMWKAQKENIFDKEKANIVLLMKKEIETALIELFPT